MNYSTRGLGTILDIVAYTVKAMKEIGCYFCFFFQITVKTLGKAKTFPTFLNKSATLGLSIGRNVTNLAFS